jgi:hypothetical protein
MLLRSLEKLTETCVDEMHSVRHETVQTLSSAGLFKWARSSPITVSTTNEAGAALLPGKSGVGAAGGTIPSTAGAVLPGKSGIGEA